MTKTSETIAALDDVRRGELTGKPGFYRGATQALILTRMESERGAAVAAALTALDGQGWTYAPRPADAMDGAGTLGWQPWHRADGLPLALWWELRTGRVRVRPGVSPAPNGAGLQEFVPFDMREAECTTEAGRFLWGNPAALARTIHRRVVAPAAPHWTGRLSHASAMTRRTLTARAAADMLVAALPNAERLPDNPLRPGEVTVRLKHWAGNHDIIVNGSGRVDLPALSVDRTTALAIAAALRSMPG
jgi:hypothetical protein